VAKNIRKYKYKPRLAVDLSKSTAVTIEGLRKSFVLQNSLSREQLIKLYAGVLFDLANTL